MSIAGQVLQVEETTVGGVLRAAAERAEGATAVVEGGPDPDRRRRWTYGALLDDSERVAAALLGRFEPGERVAVWANNVPEWLLLEFGAAFAGITLVTVNPALRQRELVYVLRQSRADGIFLLPEYRGNPMAATLAAARSELPALREVTLLSEWEPFLASGVRGQRFPSVDASSAAQIQYTSGTTGIPKGAVLHHRGITNNARFLGAVLGAGPGEAWINPMPLFHTAGCVAMTLGALQSLGPQILPPYFDPALCLALCESERAAMFGGVPTMLIAMRRHPDFRSRDLSSIHVTWSGGAPVPPDLVRELEAELDAPFLITFAQTEASPCITMTRTDDLPCDRATTVGRPFPKTEVRIADPAGGNPLAPEEVGEICTRGYHVMTEYNDDPGATARAIDGEGWLHTGDLGSMDERGFFRVSGRVKEMIIRGGENIYPKEIEQVVFSHPDVADVAVVGIPDDYWGERVVAFVRPAHATAPSQCALTELCRRQLAPHKIPAHWIFVDEFPLTASGKVQKFVLREMFAGSAE